MKSLNDVYLKYFDKPRVQKYQVVNKQMNIINIINTYISFHS